MYYNYKSILIRDSLLVNNIRDNNKEIKLTLNRVRFNTLRDR